MISTSKVNDRNGSLLSVTIVRTARIFSVSGSTMGSSMSGWPRSNSVSARASLTAVLASCLVTVGDVRALHRELLFFDMPYLSRISSMLTRESRR